MMNHLLKRALAASLLILPLSLQAEDIDIFKPPAAATAKPNILFVLDNSANWGATLYKDPITGDSVTKSRVIHQALYNLVSDNAWVGKFNMGIMTFAEGNKPKGGTLPIRIQELTGAHQTDLQEAILGKDHLISPEDSLPKTNNAPFALTFLESLLYFAGGPVLSGMQDGTYFCHPVQGCSGYDPAAINGGFYISPLDDVNNPCARNFIIFIGNGHPDSSEDGEALAYLKALGGWLPSDPIPLLPNNDEGNWADEYARFMAGLDISWTQGGDQNIATYVIDVFDPAEIQNDVDLAARVFLESIAVNGQGRYFPANDPAGLKAAIEETLLEILATNSVFAAATLPVSINVRGTNLNQIYMGVFRPNEKWLPRWMGNLKLYKLAIDAAGDIILAGADGNRVEDRANGFLLDNARSFWSYDDPANDFWDFDVANYPNPADLPDGKTVEKGGAGQRLRDAVIANGTGGRSLYTCADAACSSIVTFNDTTAGGRLNVDPVVDGVTSADLVDWVYGVNNKPGETPIEGFRKARASAHADVLHSRPAIINYGTGDDDIVAYYGTNDGVFHAVRGGKPEPGHDAPGSVYGVEKWGFIAPEFLPKLKELYLNNDAISSTAPKPYFFDGSIGSYVDPLDSAPTTAHIYPTMRRGGRAIYAFDVTDKNSVPKLLWRRDNNSTGFGQLGQTWSLPLSTHFDNGGVKTRVLIFGGGYNPAEDSSASGVTGVGNAIFFVDPVSGKVIKTLTHASMTSIPSDVGAVDLDLDGDVDRVYVGDTGGHVWRVNIDDNTPGNWTLDLLASVGSKQKFLYPPSVVRVDEITGKLAVLIGSGDREKPFDTSVQNYYYMFTDDGTTTGLSMTDLTDVTTPGTTVDLNTSKGWYFALGTGEKVVSSSVTLSGFTYFNTNQPSSVAYDPLSCKSTLGTARIYTVSYLDGTPPPDKSERSTEAAGGGLPPSPVAMTVEIDGELYSGVIIGEKPIKDEYGQVGSRKPTFWYREADE